MLLTAHPVIPRWPYRPRYLQGHTSAASFASPDPTAAAPPLLLAHPRLGDAGGEWQDEAGRASGPDSPPPAVSRVRAASPPAAPPRRAHRPPLPGPGPSPRTRTGRRQLGAREAPPCPDAVRAPRCGGRAPLQRQGRLPWSSLRLAKLVAKSCRRQPAFKAVSSCSHLVLKRIVLLPQASGIVIKH